MPLSLAHWNTTSKYDRPTGDVVYTRVLGQEVIILNSEEVAIALLEKRSQKYSDRPVFSVVNLYVALSRFHFYALSTDAYTKKAWCGMANLCRTLWVQIQVTPEIITSVLSCSSSNGLPSKANAECVPDVDPAIERPDTLRCTFHRVRTQFVYYSLQNTCLCVCRAQVLCERGHGSDIRV